MQFHSRFSLVSVRRGHWNRPTLRERQLPFHLRCARLYNEGARKKCVEPHTGKFGEVISTGICGARRRSRGSGKGGRRALRAIAGSLVKSAEEIYRIADCESTGSGRLREILEAEGYAATHRARRLHQIKRVPVPSHHGHIALRQQISQVHENFHVSGEEGGRNRLPDEEV